MNALNVLCAQLTRDLFAIAMFLYSLSCRNTLVGGKFALPSALIVSSTFTAPNYSIFVKH